MCLQEPFPLNMHLGRERRRITATHLRKHCSCFLNTLVDCLLANYMRWEHGVKIATVPAALKHRLRATNGTPAKPRLTCFVARGIFVLACRHIMYTMWQHIWMGLRCPGSLAGLLCCFMSAFLVGRRMH